MNPLSPGSIELLTLAAPQPHVLPLLRSDAFDCPYLPDRRAAMQVALSEVDSETYQTLMDRRFRRSGAMFYRPACPACRACVPIRVPVERFAPTQSQRRVLRRNEDVRVEIRPPLHDDASFDLYVRYQRAQHGGAMSGSRADFEVTLGASPIHTFAMHFTVGARLVGVGIVDQCPESLSSVYFYFDPDERRRSLGVFSALCEIEECRRRGLPFWYIGYVIDGCRKMQYKRRFQPFELLGDDGLWRDGA